MHSLRPLTLWLAVLVCACAPPTGPDIPAPTKVKTRYRVLAGISMGAIGAAALGSSRSDQFDALGLLGGPLDASLLLRGVDQFYLGGFCPLADLERIAADDPVKLNDPAVIASCSKRAQPVQFEHSQDFNHWVFTTSGTQFDRTAYGQIFSDLSLAYGNFITENALSSFAPPGVDVAWLQSPPPDFCANPVRVRGLRNAEYNPDGRYDAITFCDGQPRVFYCRDNLELVDFCADGRNVAQPVAFANEASYADTFCASKGGAAVASETDTPLLLLDNAGRADPCRRATRPLTVALAVDINGNGWRDFGEPIVNNGQERFDDVGVDGCADEREDGRGGCLSEATATVTDANGDNYDVDSRPLGTEGNWRWDEGEPFRDFGLDGVEGNFDLGEGNGAFDLSSGRRKLHAFDARARLGALAPEALARLRILTDGGVRDVFNFGLMARQVHGLLKGLRPGTTGEYRAFTELPGMVDVSGRFQPWGGKWERLPQALHVLYGKEQPSAQDRIAGEGDHVGSVDQIAHRLSTLFNWASAQWPALPVPDATTSTSSFEDRLQTRWFASEALSAKRDYVVFLPPGYELPENQGVRYPVVYLLHGYGMDPEGFAGSAILADAFMKDPAIRLRPVILVFPSGTCCFVNSLSGARDCRKRDDGGAPFRSADGWRRECSAGSFFVNRSGYTPADATRYGDAFFELMELIDREYRTLPPAEVDAR